MKKIAIILFLALCGFFTFYKTGAGGDNFAFDYDYCLFKLDDGRLYLELYYSFYQDQLKFEKVENGFEAAGELNIDLLDMISNDVMIQKNFKVPLFISDTTGYNRNKNLTGQVNFLLDSGKYRVKISATDLYNPKDSAKSVHDLLLSRFDENKVCFSGLQVASNIQKSSDTKSIFYKNTLEVVPNPSRLFGNNLSILCFYVELYNLSINNITEDYIFVSSITDLNNNEIISSEKNYKILNESKVEYGSFDVKNLKTNPYYLVAKVLDSGGNEIARTQKKFFVFNSDTTNVSYEEYKDDYLLSEYSKYTEKQADKEFHYAIYIASDNEKSEYKNIKNLEGKRKYLYEFWKKKDAVPATPVNEFKKGYFERIEYSNRNFASNFIEGWKTDRGRVYCIFGKPDEVERFPYQPDVRSYEIWHYYGLEGGIMFVFIELSYSAGDFTLVHSTARNEIFDSNWKEKLSIK